MKRLVKKSEIYDAFEQNEKYIEIFKNPTDNEIEIVKSNDPNGCIRGVIDSSNTIYIWPAEYGHYGINKKTNLPIPLDYFRFAYEPSYYEPWAFDLVRLGGNLTIEQAIQIIKNNLNFLSKIGNLNDRFALKASDGEINEEHLNEYINQYKVTKI